MNALPAHAEDFDYRLQPRELAPGAWVVVGLKEDFSFANGGNIVNTGFIVGSEGVIVIDTGSSKRYGEQMLAAIRRVTPLPIVLVVNAHQHPDHFLGNQAFPRATLAALPETIAAIRSEGEGFNANMYRLTATGCATPRSSSPSARSPPDASASAGATWSCARSAATPSPTWW